jgi:hypothetical protein
MNIRILSRSSRKAGTPEGDTRPVRDADVPVVRTRRPRRSRRRKDTVSVSPAVPVPRVPFWVSLFTDWGRPITAVVVLVLCAPGEQHLADLAGWNETLSWGFAGLFSLYAGISAVVATVRPKGARGKRSAVAGAVTSLLLAMAAQPVSHSFVTGWLTADPRPPLWLVVTVSSVPPFILGHLLHLAASPVPFGQSVPVQAVPEDITVSPVRDVPAPRPRKDTGRRAVPPVSRPALSGGDVPVLPEGTSRSVSLTKDTSVSGTPRPVPASLGDKQSLSARALELVLAGDKGDEDIKDILRDEFRDKDGTPPLPNSISKAVSRARDKASRAA